MTAFIIWLKTPPIKTIPPELQPNYCITIRTADRAPRRNYLLDTLANLERAGVFRSEIPFVMHVIDTGGSAPEFMAQLQLWRSLHAQNIEIESAAEKISPNRNAIEALTIGGKSGAEWVLFLEDDVDVCGDFLESVDKWLSDNARPSCLIYPFCAAYGAKSGRVHGKPWHYAIGGFYGTQAYAVRGTDALRIAEWMNARLAEHPMKQGHDLLLKEWSLAVNPENPHFLCPTPDFVQHKGKESSLHPGRFHEYAMFSGPTWSYVNGPASYFTLEEQRGSKFSKSLAMLIAEHLPKDDPVYDLGCGLGRYVQALRKEGFRATGLEGTPGIETIAACGDIYTVDLSRPLPSRWKKEPRGSVISLEVGEHIPKDRETVFLDNIDALCRKHLVLSWAVKGQNGLRHVNELNAEELLPKLTERGFRLLDEVTKQFREKAGAELRWFKNSIYVLERE